MTRAKWKATPERTRARRCIECGALMRTKIGEHSYVECGLPDVMLQGVTVSTCAKCGQRAVGIPAIEELHRVLAHAVADKPEPLAPVEVRFLRKWLGYSGVDFASLIGTRPETLSRWESVKAARPMPATAERLLRLMVLTREPLQEYPLEKLRKVSGEAGEAQPAKLRLRRNATAEWKPDGRAAATVP